MSEEKCNNNAGTGGPHKQDVETPPELIHAVKNFFQREITFDLAAESHNTKCPGAYFSPQENTMTKDWYEELNQPMGEAAWINPSFSSEQICKPNCEKEKCEKRGHHNEYYQAGTAEVIKKCHEESQKGMDILSLTLASFGTKWWRKDMTGLVFLLTKRVKFVGHNIVYPKDLAVTLWAPGIKGVGYIYWDWTKWI